MIKKVLMGLLGVVLIPGQVLAGTIGGTIRDDMSNTVGGISGVFIYDQLGDVVEQVVASSGVYTSPELPAGNYFVHTFNDQGLVDELFNNVDCAGSCFANLNSGTEVVVPASGAVTGIDFTLSPGSVIQGRITAMGGSPIAGVEVCVYLDGTMGIGIPTNVCGVSDGNGDYAVGGLQARNDYFLAITPGTSGTFFPEVYDDLPFDGLMFAGAAPQTVDGAMNLTGIDFELDEGAELRLSVTDNAMGPLPSYTVTLFDAQFGIPMPPVFNEDRNGVFSRAIPPGDYSVVVTPNPNDFPNLMGQFVNGLPCVPSGHCFDPFGSDAPIITLTSGNTFNQNVDLRDGVSISGNVMSQGGPVEGATILVELPNGIVVHNGDAALTDQFGDYTTDLVPQRNDLRVKAFERNTNLIPEFFDNKPFPPNFASDADPVDTRTSNPAVMGGDLPGINFDLDPGALLMGSITDPALSTGMNGISDITLEVYQADGMFLLSLPVMPGADGSYIADHGIPAGSYHIVVRQGVGFPYVSEIHDGTPCPGGFGCDFMNVTPLTFVNGSNQFDAQLEDGGVISGTVVDEMQNPIPNVPIDIFDMAGSLIGNLGSDQFGSFMVAVPSGQIHYVATADPMRQNEMFDDIPCAGGPACASVIGSATPLAPVAPNVVFANFELAGGAGGMFSISGNVVDSGTFMPIVGIAVCAYLPDGSFTGECAPTNMDGDYVIGNLGAGSFVVAAEGAQQGFANQIFGGPTCAGPCEPADFMAATPFNLGPSLTGIDFILDPVAGVSISGVVTDSSSDAPIVDVVVSLEVLGQPQSAKGVAPFATMNTDSMGTYRFDGVPPGEYRVVFSKDGFTTEQFGRHRDGSQLYCDLSLFCPERAISPLRVSTEDFTRINATLDPAGSISGQLLDNMTPIDAGFAVAAVMVLDTNGDLVTEAFQHSGAPFGINLPIGTYYLIGTVPNRAGYIDTAFGDVPCPRGACDLGALAMPVNIVTQGQMLTTDINMSLGVVLMGQILEGPGMTPIADAKAYVYDDQGRLVTFSESDPGGNYLTETGLPDGNYFLASVDVESGRGVFAMTGLNIVDEVFDGLDCPSGLCDPTSGTPIALAIGNSPAETRDLILERGGFVTGTIVSRGEARPIPGVLVNAYDFSGNLVARSETNRDGMYRVGPVRAGSYFASTDASDRGFFDKIYDDLVCVESLCEDNVTNGTSIAVAIPPTDNTPASADFVLGAGGSLRAENLRDQDRLGAAVARCNGLIAVGVPGDDEMGQDAGAALIYRRDGSGYRRSAKVFGTPAEPGAMFGTTVACGGDFFVFGSSGDGAGAKQGATPDKAAFVFQLTGGGGMTQVQQIVQQNLAPSANFASAIALDGNSMAIGAPGATGGGMVVMFNNAGGANPWAAQTTISDDDLMGTNAGFGSALAVENGQVVVGAPSAPASQSNPLATGVAAMFTNVSGTNAWDQVGKFTNTNPGAPSNSGDQFGASVSLSGNMIAIGAPGSDAAATDGGAAFIFEAGGNFNQMATLLPTAQQSGDAFGSVVQLAGGSVAIGAPGADGAQADTGLAYVFDFDGGQWNQSQTIEPQGSTSGSAFGGALAFDGTTVVVGAPDDSLSGNSTGNVQVFSDADELFSGGFE